MKFRPKNDGKVWISWSDFLFLFAMIFVFMYMPHKKNDNQAIKDGVTAGKLCVELFWEDGKNIDLDLIGRGPDGKVAMYSNKSTPLMDLLRDDLGTYQNPSGRNFETICSRTLAEGEWTFNASYYGDHEPGPMPEMPIKLIVSFPIGDAGVRTQPQIVVNNVLKQVGDEITVIDFYLDKNGVVVPGSLNSVFQPLRSSKDGANVTP